MSERWHIEKGVNVVMLLVVVSQLVGFGVLYGKLEQRVTSLEAQVSHWQSVPERLARLEVLLERIERQLSRAGGR